MDYQSTDSGILSSFSLRLQILIGTSGSTDADVQKKRQLDIAKSLGVARQTVANWIHGKTIPDGILLAKLSDYFNVSVDYLLGKTEIMTPNMEDRTICEKTSLSLQALFALRLYTEHYPKEFEKLLTHDDYNFFRFLNALKRQDELLFQAISDLQAYKESLTNNLHYTPYQNASGFPVSKELHLADQQMETAEAELALATLTMTRTLDGINKPRFNQYQELRNEDVFKKIEALVIKEVLGESKILIRDTPNDKEN